MNSKLVCLAKLQSQHCLEAPNLRKCIVEVLNAAPLMARLRSRVDVDGTTLACRHSTRRSTSQYFPRTQTSARTWNRTSSFHILPPIHNLLAHLLVPWRAFVLHDTTSSRRQTQIISSSSHAHPLFTKSSQPIANASLHGVVMIINALGSTASMYLRTPPRAQAQHRVLLSHLQ